MDLVIVTLHTSWNWRTYSTAEGAWTKSYDLGVLEASVSDKEPLELGSKRQEPGDVSGRRHEPTVC